MNQSQDNPYLPPNAPSQIPAPAEESAWRWGIIVAGNLILIPVYMIVLIASVQELVEVKDITARGAVDYWRHASASLLSLGICLITLFLVRRRNSLAWYFFAASSLFLLITIYPGLNVVWNAVAGFIP